jgi:two-component system, NtrC family, sensor kinase
MRRGAKPGKAKVEAELAAARKSLRNDPSGRRDVEKRLAEAQEQQTATAEILRVISSSPTDVQPVFDTIVRSAVRLCGALFSGLYQFDGELIHQVAQHNFTRDALEAAHRLFPARPTRGMGSGRAILERAVVHIPDVEHDPEYQQQSLSRTIGFRSAIYVPMLREGGPIGVIVVARAEPGPFSDNQIELLKTFADQGVIAIENVRLFTELQEKNRALIEAHAQVTESLDQQTVTSEILRVISRSPTDVQPIFDAIVRSASRLCGGEYAIVTRFDGELLHLAAQHNPRPGTADETARLFPQVPRRETSITARALIDAVVVHVSNIETEELDPSMLESYRRIMLRAVVAVPMMQEGRPIGVVSVSRGTPGPFSHRQIDLLRTFADQAVIAIENVRLFTELGARNRDLTEALEQQTATSEVLKVISRSTFDLQPVLQMLIENATRLCSAEAGVIFRFDGELQRLAAACNVSSEFRDFVERNPLRSGPGTAVGRAMLGGRAVHIHDVLADPDYTYPGVGLGGYRTILGIPMLREGIPVGVLSVWRKQVLPFTDKQIELVTTFADQGVIAIENVRLFREIADKSAQLEAASRHKSEFLANMSHELRTPLNAIIGFSEVLVDRMFGELNEKQEEYLKDIYASGQHLLSLINDILDLSKIEAGRMELEATDFDLPSAIDNALTLVRERATRRGITLGRTIDERLGMLRGDERKVKQVLLNLLSNALKFTPEGGRIDVSARMHDEVAEIAVTDTGVGIAPEDQEAVFEEFRQVGTADKKVEGTGLGLALSRKFIELHGGRIWVKSQLGAGSTFTFTLAVRRGE